MSVPLRYRRHNVHATHAHAQPAAPPIESHQTFTSERPQHFAGARSDKAVSPNTYDYPANYASAAEQQEYAYHQQHQQYGYPNQYYPQQLQFQPQQYQYQHQEYYGHSSPQMQHHTHQQQQHFPHQYYSPQPEYASYGHQSPQMQSPYSPSLEQKVAREPRAYNRADRTVGRILDKEKELGPNQAAIDKLIASTASLSLSTRSGSSSSSVNTADPEPKPKSSAAPAARYKSNGHSNASTKYAVTIKLPSRKVVKNIAHTTKVSDLIAQLVKEHRLEFDFEHNTENDEEIILWESVDGTRRPLRITEQIGPIVSRWGSRSQRYYLRTTSTAPRHDVDSLASLVPRRDMLRTPPKLLASDVHFSRPSVMYNPHLNVHDPRSPPISPNPDAATEVNKAGFVANKSGGSGVGLHRARSKLNPHDEALRAKRIEADNDDVSLQTQLVWGFGSLDLENGRLTLKQKPGDELVCSLEIAGADVYEWPHAGPKKYVFALRAQQPNSRAVFVSTDSPKVFNVVRNAVFTARSKALMEEQNPQYKR